MDEVSVYFGILTFLEKEYSNRKLGSLLQAAISLIILILSTPFVKWIYIINSYQLYASLGLNEDTIQQLTNGYSILNILSFVEISRFGVIGLYAMILLILAISAILFHVIYLAAIVFKWYGQNGLLAVYTKAKTGILLSAITSAATIGYVVFANRQFGVAGFSLSIAVYIVQALSICGYIIIKVMEKKERTLRNEHGLLEEIRRNWVLFLFLLPCFGYLLINNYLPMAGVYFAFTQFNFRDGLFASPFVGFKNFEFLVQANLLRLTSNTILYNIVFIVLGNTLQIFFAIMISRIASKKFKKVSQTLIFMPYFVSFVILKVLVYNIFEYDFGLINYYISSAGGDKIDFYNTPTYWPFLITIFHIWKNLGYGVVIYLASILGISEEYYEAAKVDGANVFQQINHITLPLLKSTFIILLLYSLGSIMKGQFELFYQIVGNNGILFNATDIFDTYVYRITTTQPLSMGLGTAAGLYQSAFGFVIIVVTNFIIKRKHPEYALF